MELFSLLLPEIVVVLTSLVLFLFGVVKSSTVRTVVPWVALAGLVTAGIIATFASPYGGGDFTGAVVGDALANYSKVLVCVVGVILLLLCWPTQQDGGGNVALHYGLDAAEFFGLVLLSLCGVMLVAGADDTMLLFMGIELASIPTYVLVVMGRPLAKSQEAGLKYFYLGAMAAAVLLLGFAYLYGVTGTTNLTDSAAILAGGEGALGGILVGSTWKTLALILLVLGLCFKLAAFPLHFYAGDVYTGAATPVTAILSFVPKATGILALVKLLLVAGAGTAAGVSPIVWHTLLVISIVTMFVGNMMALLTENLKRVMAYSSIAHSGYMLAALTALAAAGNVTGGHSSIVALAITAVLVYLAAYGVMNAGIFGVLMMLPTRERVVDAAGEVFRPPATSAETYAEIRGVGRRHPTLVVAMAICCISLIGIPLTVGFIGKLYIFQPAVKLAQDASNGSSRLLMWVLIGSIAVNAAIAAAYYLRIISEMVLGKSPEEEDADADGQPYESAPAPRQPWPVLAATGLSAGGALFLGGIAPQTLQGLTNAAEVAARSASARYASSDDVEMQLLERDIVTPTATFDPDVLELDN